MGSTLKVRSPEAKTLVDKIKAERQKRAELKAQRMLLKAQKEAEAPAARLELSSPKCPQSSGVAGTQSFKKVLRGPTPLIRQCVFVFVRIQSEALKARSVTPPRIDANDPDQTSAGPGRNVLPPKLQTCSDPKGGWGLPDRQCNSKRMDAEEG